MGRSTDAMLFILSMNIAVMILSGAGFTPLIGQSGTAIVDADSMNTTRLIPTAGDPLTGIFVFWNALIVAWGVVTHIIGGFPLYLSEMGAPSWLVVPLGIAWVFIFFMWALHLATGRDVGD